MKQRFSKKPLLYASLFSTFAISVALPFSFSRYHPTATRANVGYASINPHKAAHKEEHASLQPIPPKFAIFSFPFFRPHVKIVTYGTGVTSADINLVKTLLTKANSVQRISKFLGMKMNQSAKIILVQNAAGYSQALKSIGVPSSEASSLSEDSNGFTLDSTVIVPLFQNTSDTDLANTLTHELTHVNINQHISNIPSWMNEGMAVYMGMNGQESIENPLDFQSDELEYAEEILSVVQSKQLVPLTGYEAAILNGQDTYDYELQDWLAVCDLISKYGKSSISTLAHYLENESPDQAFLDTFGESVSTFNDQFTKQLDISAAVHNTGATLQMNFLPDYEGLVLFQGPNQAKNSAFVATPGEHTVVVHANGTVSTNLSAVGMKTSENLSDPGSMYVSLVPFKVMKIDNSKLKSGDFQINLSNGLYSYNDSWEELENNPVFNQSNAPSILGVSITSIKDESENNPILTILATEQQ